MKHQTDILVILEIGQLNRFGLIKDKGILKYIAFCFEKMHNFEHLT
jgi:hypothetical protein